MQRNPYQRKMCPQCRYPMLLLRNFEGVSSADADRHDTNFPTSVKFGCGGVIIGMLVGEGWKAFKSRGKKKKVAELKAELLQQYPSTLICPQCMHVEPEF